MSKTRFHGICKKSGKRIYWDKLDCLLDHAKNPRKIRAYECPHSEPGKPHYHATSRPERRAA